MRVNKMHEETLYPLEKKELYHLLKLQVKELIREDRFLISSLSNVAALLWEALQDINWVGFYLLNEEVLYLGPFQGKVACVEIKTGKGVCGTAVSEDRTQRVEDVHTFPGHIACDSASNSEIVIPIHKDGKVVAVLDVDSPDLCRFTEDDQEGLEEIVKLLEGKWNTVLWK